MPKLVDTVILLAIALSLCVALVVTFVNLSEPPPPPPPARKHRFVDITPPPEAPPQCTLEVVHIGGTTLWCEVCPGRRSCAGG
jgi:hypothetical protein